MWIAIGVGIPVLVLSIAIAFWPVMSRSYRYHRWEHRRSERTHRPMRRGHVMKGCPMCEASFEAPTDAAAVAAKNEHVLREHAQSGSEALPSEETPLTAMTTGIARGA